MPRCPFSPGFEAQPTVTFPGCFQSAVLERSDTERETQGLLELSCACSRQMAWGMQLKPETLIAGLESDGDGLRAREYSSDEYLDNRLLYCDLNNFEVVDAHGDATVLVMLADSGADNVAYAGCVTGPRIVMPLFTVRKAILASKIERFANRTCGRQASEVFGFGVARDESALRVVHAVNSPWPLALR